MTELASSASTPTSHPLHLPEVLILIASHLPPADQASGTQVCKTWFIPFASQLWRSIQPDQWTHPSLAQALPRYSVLVRELRCAAFDDLGPLGPEATQLELLVPPMITFQSQELVKRVLKRNRELRDLSLRMEIMYPRDLFGEWLDLCGGLKKLRQLQLIGVQSTGQSLEELVSKSEVLESLVLEDWVTVLDRNPYVPKEPGTVATPSPVLTPCQTLKSLTVKGFRDAFGGILHVAKWAPNLEALHLSDNYYPPADLTLSAELTRFVEQLQVFCPKLDRLRLECQEGEIDRLWFKTLLKAFPRLKSFYSHVSTPGVGRHEFMDIVLDMPEYVETLEEIQRADLKVLHTWRGCWEVDVEASRQVGMALRKFPRLKKVSMAKFTIHVEDLVQVGDEADGEESKSVPWVCDGLEELWLVVGGPKGWLPVWKGRNYEGQSMPYKLRVDWGDQVLHPLFRKLDEQLNRLTKLTNLEVHLDEIW